MLMSCFNAERWLGQALESVVHQTCRDFEFLIVDDGSTDTTWQIISAFGSNDERIVAIRKQNTGLAHSLNLGIDHAKGKWIARMDADDICHPTRLEKQLAFVERNPSIVLLGSGFEEVDEWNRTLRVHTYPATHRRLLRNLRRSQRFFPHSSSFFLRDAARRVGSYNPRFVRSQDKDLWLRIAEQGNIGCLSHPLVRVRKHSLQASEEEGGLTQLVYGTAASACHYLRIERQPDPSLGSDSEIWEKFVSLVRDAIRGAQVAKQRRIWAEARQALLRSQGDIPAYLSFGRTILESGYLVSLALQWFWGSSLPRRIAKSWMRKACAAS